MAPPTPTKVEKAKDGSDYLRGTVTETLRSEASHFEHDDLQVLKFHGIYQQDDRDERIARLKAKEDKAWSFMVRAKLPGGRLSGAQYLALDEIADRVSGDRSLRVTTRQGFQLHGVLKGELKPAIRAMNDALISTLAACGDVERNVMASPAPFADPARERLHELAADIARELCPATGAYHEIWIRDASDPEAPKEKISTHGEEEPFYGPDYLPRKFKTAVAVPEDNSVDVHSQDCALLAVVEDGRLVGANLLVGGGLGMSHKKADTFARLGTPVGFVRAARLVDAVRAAVAIFRDHGNRTDRKHARLKYLIEAWGLPRFRAELEERLGESLEPTREVGEVRFADFLGPHPQGDGRWFYGLFVQSGRIDGALKAALREIVERLDPGVTLTPSQNLYLTGLQEADVALVDAILQDHGARPPRRLSAVRRFSMACPALPTCGLALAEAERIVPSVLDELEQELTALGLGDEPMTVRMTGCPNGCARPYTADIGLVGHGPGFYDVFLGGRLAGDRLADLYASRLPIDDLLPTLRPLFRAWRDDLRIGEGFGDFYHRRFGQGWRTILTGDRDGTARERVEEELGTTVPA